MKELIASAIIGGGSVIVVGSVVRVGTYIVRGVYNDLVSIYRASRKVFQK